VNGDVISDTIGLGLHGVWKKDAIILLSATPHTLWFINWA